MQRLQPLQNGQFGSKTKNATKMRKTIVQEHQSCSAQKTAPKNHIPKKRPLLKSAILQRLQPMQRLQPLQNGQFGSKIKNAKNMGKTILQEHWSCSVKKTAKKNTKYSRDETILKIGHFLKATAHSKAIAFAKWSVWVKN